MSAEEYTTAVGWFADSVGAVQWVDRDVERVIGPGGREITRVTERTTTKRQPASQYASFQPADLPLLWEHRRAAEIGKVVLLDRRGGRLCAVSVLGPHPPGAFDDLADELFLSAATIGVAPFTLTELSLTTDPATLALPPVQFFKGQPDEAMLFDDGRPRALLRRAAEVVNAAHGIQYAGCRFDDLDAPRRVEGRASEPMEMHYGPIGRVLSVGGRPPRGPH